MNSQADKQLKLVILAQPVTSSLNPGDQPGIHSSQLSGPGHCAGSSVRWIESSRGVSRAVVGATSNSQLRLVEVINNF